MNARRLLRAALFLSTVAGCSDALLDRRFQDGDFFYLESRGAIMPVWVRGNTSTGTFIVFLHGGPGNSSFDYAISPAFEDLSRDYALVLWDQRGSGASQGNPQPDTLTLAQFVEDTDRLLALVRALYAPSAVFLLGKSWGGAVGTAFLLDETRQAPLSGWIEVDGAHNLEDGVPLSWQWVTERANQRIDEGRDSGYWQRELGWYQTRPETLDAGYFIRHGRNLNRLGGIYRNPAEDRGDWLPIASPLPLFHQLSAYYLNEDNRLDLRHLSLSAEMWRITLPALILWGRHDGTLPVALAEDAHRSLGTPLADRHLFVFENSAHMPSEEEPEEFAGVVRRFIEQYRTRPASSRGQTAPGH